MIFIWFFDKTESGEFCMFAPIFLDGKYAKKKLIEVANYQHNG